MYIVYKCTNKIYYYILVTVGCLILLQRYTKRRARYLTLSNDVAASNNAIQNLEAVSQAADDQQRNSRNSYRPFPENPQSCSNNNGCCGEGGENSCNGKNTNPKRVIDIEDLSRGNTQRNIVDTAQ